MLTKYQGFFFTLLLFTPTQEPMPLTCEPDSIFSDLRPFEPLVTKVVQDLYHIHGSRTTPVGAKAVTPAL